MFRVLLFLSLACPDTKIQNVSGLPWNQHDQETLDGAKKRCGELYPDSPCVKLFRKYAFQSYSVICGEPDGN